MMPMSASGVTVSIISHNQAALAQRLIGDLLAHCGRDIDIILTSNIPEDLSELPKSVQVIRNLSPKGFGANHNAAFKAFSAEYFCVANPDVRLRSNPFPPLLAALAHGHVGVAAPLVSSPHGEPEDSARRFPTAASLFRKLLGSAPRLDYEIGYTPISPDWVAGMFMLFRGDIFQAIDGFDERYFLYYEDVDLCARVQLAGLTVVLDPSSTVVHDARRASRGNPRHAWWHMRSMIRYLASPVYHKLRERRLI